MYVQSLSLDFLAIWSKYYSRLSEFADKTSSWTAEKLEKKLERTQIQDEFIL